MANEITVSGSISAFKTGSMSTSVGRALIARQFTMTGTTFIEGLMSVLTSVSAVPLGGVTAPHWSWFYNTDATNYINLRNGSAGALVVKLKPGEFALFPWEDSAVPYAIANVATCLMEYLIFQL